MTFSERVKLLREMQQMTQTELAKRADLGRTHIVLIEQGVRGNPTLAVLRKVAQGLGVTPGALLDGTKFEAATAG